MKIVYLYHDGFLVELERHILLFDYWKGGLPAADAGKSLLVFASHVHPDHFSFEIFRLSESSGNVHYFLGNDIGRRFNERSFLKHGVSEEAYRQISFLKAGADADTDGCRIRTLKSTDTGVAFRISCEGREIFHAGDLNDWSFSGNSETENRTEKNSFRSILDGIRGAHFDTAFFPLDPRQEEHAFDGFDYFMRNTDTDEVFPMHRWGDTEIIGRLAADPVSEPYREKIRDPEKFKQTGAVCR